MEQEKESDILRLLNWALMTIKDKLQFGLPEEIAIQRREIRVKGVLVDVIEQVTELEGQLAHVIDLSKEIEQNYLVEKEKVAKSIELLKEYKEKYYEHAPFCTVGKYDNRCDCGVDNWQDEVDNFIAGNYVQKDDAMLTTKEVLAVTITLFKELKVEKEAIEAELKVFKDAQEAALTELSEHGQYE